VPIPTTDPVTTPRVLLRDIVHDKIRDAIMDGTFTPGERLNDDELIEWLGVSRTPIRDALNELTRVGLVDMSANRYTRVANPEPAQVIEALQTLGVILGGVVRLAVPLLDDKARKPILADIDLAISACEDEDQPTLNTVMLRMFNRYVDHCGNDTLIKLCHDNLDGLAFKLHIASLNTIVDFTTFSGNLPTLRSATIGKDPIAAELATEALHLLPGTR
jgi:DNA-binding GntR family transcriptional regulator